MDKRGDKAEYRIRATSFHRGKTAAGGIPVEGTSDVRWTRPDGSMLGSVFVQPQADETAEDAVRRALAEAGISAIMRTYYQSIHSMADEIREEIRDGTIQTSDDAHERIHETIDGCYWVIYYHAQRQVLLVSDNETEGFDRFIDTGGTLTGPGFGPLVYCIVEADLCDALGDIDDLIVEREEAREAAERTDASE